MEAVNPRKSRSLAAALEPVIGQVFFSPECHAAYAKLGFSPSPGRAGLVALPDGPAYFTSRGSLLGQVRPGVVAAAFGGVKPDIGSGWGAPRLVAHRCRHDLRRAPGRRSRATRTGSGRSRRGGEPSLGAPRAR